MTLLAFIWDKSLSIVFNLLGMITVSVFLPATGSSVSSVILICIGWIVILLVWLITGYSQRQRYFNKINYQLCQLDKPYLIAEVMDTPYRLDDRMYLDILRKSNKSVIEKVYQLEMEKQEYKEYIESWIHEVKTPMAAMALLCQNNPGETGEKIMAEVDKIDNYVEMALFYARSDEVYKDYMIQKTDLQQIVYHTISKNKHFFIQNHMSIRVECEDCIVFTDSKWIEFILNQILINCVKYKKRQTGSVHIYAEKKNKAVHCIIEDDGIGIDATELHRVFDKGFTGSNGRKSNHSTGIGLYLCKKLCRKLDIGLEIQSEVQQFTKVILIFPVAKYDILPKL